MYSCRKAAQKLSEAQERELTWFERIRMWLMLRVCEPTRRCKRQFEGIDQVASKRIDCPHAGMKKEELCQDSKSRLKALLAEADSST